MLVRREAQGDAAAIDAVHRAAFPGPVEADLVRALRADAGWVAALSLVLEVPAQGVVGHVVCTQATVGDGPALGLGPVGVLPDHQGRGVGTALLHAVLGAADALEYPLVVLLGHRDYYPRFGFVPAAELGIEAPDPTWGAHFQARTLATYAPSCRGPFRYAAPFAQL